MTDVVEHIDYQGKKFVCFVNRFGGGLVESFAKLAPKTIQHEFGGGFTSRVLNNEVWVEIDPYSLLVLIDVPNFVCGGDGPSGVAGRLLRDLQPSIHVVSRVPFLPCGKCQTSCSGVCWQRRDFSNRDFFHFFHAGSTEGKS